MAAYPMAAFSYPSPSALPMQFQQPYLTAVPMACKFVVVGRACEESWSLVCPSSTDLPSPDVVAAQGALVSVGSSYVTYIDKKGQVRLWQEEKNEQRRSVSHACLIAREFAAVCVPSIICSVYLFSSKYNETYVNTSRHDVLEPSLSDCMLHDARGSISSWSGH